MEDPSCKILGAKEFFLSWLVTGVMDCKEAIAVVKFDTGISFMNKQDENCLLSDKAEGRVLLVVISCKPIWTIGERLTCNIYLRRCREPEEEPSSLL